MRVKLSVLSSNCVTAMLVGTPGLTVPGEGHRTPVFGVAAHGGDRRQTTTSFSCYCFKFSAQCPDPAGPQAGPPRLPGPAWRDVRPGDGRGLSGTVQEVGCWTTGAPHVCRVSRGTSGGWGTW